MLAQILIHLRPKAVSVRFTIVALLFLSLFPYTQAKAAAVHEEDGKTFIVDQKGERWEITQALSLGFRPGGFQFGIGRDAIRPLDDQHLRTEDTTLPGQSRVIGISDAKSAHAYSIGRLTRHEIANTRLEGTPIAAAY